jgi:hypothetical protein
MNIWKISTLVLAGAFVVVVGRGAVQDSYACDDNEQTAEQLTQIRFARALSFLQKAEQEVRAAPAAQPRIQRAMLQQIGMAKGQIQKALFVEDDSMMQPRPMKKQVVAF